MAGFWDDVHDYEDYRSTAWLDPEERNRRDASHENREAYWARQEEALVRHDCELRDQYYGTLRFPYQQASLWLPPEEHMPAPSAPQHISYRSRAKQVAKCNKMPVYFPFFPSSLESLHKGFVQYVPTHRCTSADSECSSDWMHTPRPDQTPTTSAASPTSPAMIADLV